MTDIAASSPASGSARLGVLLMLLGMVMFSLNDVLGKWLVATYSVGQLMLIRSFAALVVLTPFFWRMGWRRLIDVERPKLHVLRAALFAVEASGFYFAVAYMPLADAMTYWLAAPIYVAALSSVMLGEKVGWRRWTAIIVGFIGVLIALSPSKETFTLPALIALAGSMAFGLAMVLGRTLRATPDTTLVFWQIAGAGIFRRHVPCRSCRLGAGERRRLRSSQPARHRGDERAHAGQPFTEAGGCRDRRAAAIYAAALGGRLRLDVLRRHAAFGHAGRRGLHRRLRPLHLLPRTAAEAARAFYLKRPWRCRTSIL